MLKAHRHGGRLTIGTSQLRQTEALTPGWGRPEGWGSHRPAAGSAVQGETSDRLASCALFGGDFQRLLASGSAERLGVPVQIHPAGIWQVSPPQFRARVQEPTCCCRLTVRPPAYAHGGASPEAPAESIWLEFTPPLARAMVNLLLGAGIQAEVLTDERPLTGLERGLLRHIAEVVAGALTVAWLTGTCPSISVGRDEYVPQSPGLQADDQLLAVLSFSLSIAGQVGVMRLAMAPALLESLLPDRPVAGANQKALELSAALPEISLAAEELARLAPGDILLTDTPPDGQTVVRLAGIAKFTARLGRWGSRRAVSITGRLAPPAPGQARPS